MLRDVALQIASSGGPRDLRLVHYPVEKPGPGQIRVRVRAAGVGATDLMVLAGRYGFAPKPPVVPGYEVAGVVEAVGAGVDTWRIGQRVAALTVYGGFASTLLRDASECVQIPDAVTDVDAAAVILNHVSAFQMVSRVARAQPGETAVVTGAGGGVGSALLQQLRLAGVNTCGAASARRHGAIVRLGAVPLDRNAGCLDQLVRQRFPTGVDHAFDAIGYAQVVPCIRALRAGGGLVGFGFMGGSGKLATARMFAQIFAGSFLRGRRGSFYGITLRYRRDPRPFREDLARVFQQLQRREIDPLIEQVLPLKDGPRALTHLAAGETNGKIVLVP